MEVQRTEYAILHSEELQRVLSYQQKLQNEGRKPHVQN